MVSLGYSSCFCSFVMSDFLMAQLIETSKPLSLSLLSHFVKTESHQTTHKTTAQYHGNPSHLLSVLGAFPPLSYNTDAAPVLTKARQQWH